MACSSESICILPSNLTHIWLDIKFWIREFWKHWYNIFQILMLLLKSHIILLFDSFTRKKYVGSSLLFVLGNFIITFLDVHAFSSVCVALQELLFNMGIWEFQFWEIFLNCFLNSLFSEFFFSFLELLCWDMGPYWFSFYHIFSLPMFFLFYE